MPATTTLPLDVDIVAQELKAIVQGIGKGTGSGFEYAQNVRRELTKEHDQTIRKVVAYLYDAITHRGCSASEATGWLYELIARCEEWEDRREGVKVGAPDLLPLIRRETRFEHAENDATHCLLAAQGTDAEEAAIRKWIATTEQEIDAAKLAVSVGRDKLAALGRGRGLGAPASVASVRRQLAGRTAAVSR
jgi:hypothetical protein